MTRYATTVVIEAENVEQAIELHRHIEEAVKEWGTARSLFMLIETPPLGPLR